MGDSVSSKNDSSSANTSVADPRNIKVFGEEFEFDAWYSCPSYFSDEERKKYAGNLLERLYVCSRCFKYTSKASEMGQHWVRQCLFFLFFLFCRFLVLAMLFASRCVCPSAVEFSVTQIDLELIANGHLKFQEKYALTSSTRLYTLIVMLISSSLAI
ncbi:hypothetical protein V1527DRAFT_458487 [Lipomyces starkeyi]